MPSETYKLDDDATGNVGMTGGTTGGNEDPQEPAMPAELLVAADLEAAEGQADLFHKSKEWPFSFPLATPQV
jgi:hypothetical protein